MLDQIENVTDSTAAITGPEIYRVTVHQTRSVYIQDREIWKGSKFVTEDRMYTRGAAFAERDRLRGHNIVSNVLDLRGEIVRSQS